MAEHKGRPIGTGNSSFRDNEGLMKTNLNIRIDEHDLTAPAGLSVAAALILNGYINFRVADRSEARGLFCGMGACYDCLVEVDGLPDQRACMTLIEEGMRIRTYKEAR